MLEQSCHFSSNAANISKSPKGTSAIRRETSASFFRDDPRYVADGFSIEARDTSRVKYNSQNTLCITFAAGTAAITINPACLAAAMYRRSRAPGVNETTSVPQKSPRRRFKFGGRITPTVPAFLSISHFEPPIPQPYVTCQIGFIGFPAVLLFPHRCRGPHGIA
jgi:hypothetical protein